MNAETVIARAVRLGSLCLLALGASVHAQNGDWVFNQFGPNQWGHSYYVDFSTTTTLAGHVDHPTGTFGGVGGIKYKSLQIDNAGQSNQCWELSTSAPRFLPAVNSDTRIWITSHLGHPTPVSLHDDINGAANRYSNARFWLTGSPSSFVNLAVAAYSTGSNTIHFSLNVIKLPLDEAACTTGQTMPWVKVINGNMTKSP